MIGAVVGVLVIIGAVALAIAYANSLAQRRPLYPLLATPTPPDKVISPSAEQIDFRTLNEDPAAYLNRVIQVTGAYTPVEPPSCRPHAGPMITWSLVADSLQLNARGLEPILRLVNPGTAMTVEGVWRLHNGPVGCGKEPPDEVVWYLEASRVIAPNPLFGGPEVALTFVPGDPTSAALTTPEPAATSQPLATDTTQTGTPATAPSPAATLGPGLYPAPGTPTELPVTPLATPVGTATPQGTAVGPQPATVTPSPTGTPNGTPTTGPAVTGTPGLATATPGGYPPPTGYP